ncbi:MAG: DegT/DnrJ/EryC1/StrS family aminotransferase, partial [Patescibacteria group bacterium]
SDFEKKITSRSRVVLLQHSFGITPKQRNNIIRKAQSSGILVVEDLAHGFDEKVFKEDVKTIKLLSFGRSKNISSVFGGAIALTDNDLIHWFKNTEKTLKYPTFGFIYRLLLYKAFAPFIRSTYDWGLGKTLHKICTIIGLFPAEISALEKEGTYDNLFEKAYPNVLATLLLKQIKYFDLKLKKKYDAIELYETCFHTFNGHPSHTLCRYPALIQNRDKVIKSLSKHNIFLGKWYDQPVAPKSVDLKTVSYKSGSCPTAETICKQIINLPVNVRTRQARRIITLIKKYESN